METRETDRALGALRRRGIAVQPMASLPNEHGLQFRAFDANGTEFSCRVTKGADGLHRVEGHAFAKLVGWRA